jgi:hydroxyethylthiazole kinase-like uncharacterized protein yjeF
VSAPTILTRDALRAWPLPQPGGEADKDSRGKVLVIAGGAACPGAALLAGEAALRSGAGKVQVATAAVVAPALGLAFPESRVVPLPESGDGEIAGEATESLLKLASRADVILIGPGMLDGDAAAALVTRLLAEAPDAAFLLDAAALEQLGRQGDAFRRRRVAITPHAGEMAKLLGAEREAIEADPAAFARRAAAELGLATALKGAATHIHDPEGRAWLLPESPNGLGTAGSGDVLAGLAAGLLARGADPAQALVYAVWTHAEAGRRAEAETGPLGYLARQLSPNFPAILGEIAA